MPDDEQFNQLLKKVETIEIQMEARRAQVDPIIAYVNTRMAAEQEWHTFVKELRVKLATNGLLALFAVFGGVTWYGIKHWLRSGG